MYTDGVSREHSRDLLLIKVIPTSSQTISRDSADCHDGNKALIKYDHVLINRLHNLFIISNVYPLL